MTKRIDSLLSLINTLSKAEKKHISIALVRGNENNDYVILYDILLKMKSKDSKSVELQFYKKKPESSFDMAVHYLYERTLNTIILLQKESDKYYSVFNEINKARLLYSKSMFQEALETLSKAEERAQLHQNYEALLIINKLELEYLLRLNFPNMTEKELNHKHFIQNETIKKIRKITDQGSLFNLLKLRMTRRGMIRTEQQKKAMNDLMVNELYLAASSDMENDFEIMKNHKLFQANYLMSVGDYNSAFNSYKELNGLFEENPQLWLNPPVYYLTVLEGILDSLRSMDKYDEMPVFLQKLEKLKEGTSAEFQLNISCLQYQYQLFPYLDKGMFSESYNITLSYRSQIEGKLGMLTSMRYSEYNLYSAIACFCVKKYDEAKSLLNRIILDRNDEFFQIAKIIRLVRLITYYELGEYGLVEYESRSIRRGLSLKREQSYRTEHAVLSFLSNCYIPILKEERVDMWNKLLPSIESIRKDRYENQLLKIFDFTAWLQSTIMKEDLSSVLRLKFSKMDE